MAEREFVLPLQAEDLETGGADDRYVVANRSDVKDMGGPAALAALNGLDRTLDATPTAVAEQDNFDLLYSFVIVFPELDKKVQELLVQLLRNALGRLLKRVSKLSKDGNRQQNDEVGVCRNAVKMYCFLLTTTVAACERMSKTALLAKGPAKKGRGKKAAEPVVGFNWEAAKLPVAAALVAVIESPDVFRLWNMGAPEEDFGSLFFKLAVDMLEVPENVKSKDVKLCLFKLFILPVKRFQLFVRATAAFVNLLHNCEHLPSVLAELMGSFVHEHDCVRFANDVIRELGRMSTAASAPESAGARNVAAFLSDLGEKVPKVVLASLSVLVEHLDAEAYSMRNGVVQMIGKVLQHGFPSGEQVSDLAQKQRRTLFSLLLQRARDVSSYTRSKVLQTWIDLVAADAVPMRLLPSVVALAASRTQDKSSSVRKFAVVLLTALLRHNPFAPQLSREQFETDLQRVAEDFKEAMTNLREQAADAKRQRQQDEANALASEEQGAEDEEVQEAEEEEEEDGASGEDDERPRRRRAPKKVQAQPEPQEDEDNKESDEHARSAAAALLGSDLSEDDILAVMPEDQHAAFRKKRTDLDYLFDAVRFIGEVEKCTDALCNLLSSKTLSDVQECIRYFVVAHQFRLSSANVGVRRMLVLIWSTEAPVREAVIEAYCGLYVGEMEQFQGPLKHQRALQVASALVRLMADATLADLTSMEELLSTLMQLKRFPLLVTDALWSIFAGKVAGFSAADICSALLLVSMLANARPALITGNLATLVDVGFGERAREHPALLRAVCVALQRAAPKDCWAYTAALPGADAASADTMRTLLTAPCMGAVRERLAWLLTRNGGASASAAERDGWFTAAEQAINAIFVLHPQPHQEAARLLQELSEHCGLASGAQISSEGLSRLLFAVGHVAVKMVVLLERMEKHLKAQRRTAHAAKDARNEAAAAAPQPVAAPKARRAGRKAAKEEDDEEEENKDEDEEELDDEEEVKPKAKAAGRRKKAQPEPAQPAAAEPAVAAPARAAGKSKIEDELAVSASVDHDIEVARERAESSLLDHTRHLLGAFGPLVVHVCRHPTRYSDPLLQASAVLALCKLMTVNNGFCEKNLSLLITLMTRATDSRTRANVIISLGDMAARFPNTVEPWSEHMYSALKDTDTSTRKNALMVLSHLILNNMIKIKGPISDMALCLEDAEPRIAELSRMFFQELATKGEAPIYNLLPEAISRLSAAEVPEPTFRRVLEFLEAFVTKEKQVESLVDKLCKRLAEAGSARQWRDVAFCLSQLSYTDRCLKRLSEHFPSYKDRLADEDVFASLSAVVARARKFAKAEVKTLLDDLEAKLAAARAKHCEDQSAVTKAGAVRHKYRGADLRGAAADEEEEEKEADKENAPAQPQAARRGGKRAARGKPAARGRARAQPAAKATRARGKGRAPARRRARDSDDDEEEEEEEDEEVEELEV